MTDYFEHRGEEIGVEDLKLPGSLSMLSAVQRSPDCELVSCFQYVNDGVRVECIVLDICNDQIPSRNGYGIQYRERVAYGFCHGSNIPFTASWRKDFPETMHQNPTQPGAPKSLCLFDQHESVTLMTWTPERHIQRTKWWLTQASHGQLHADDQEVEPLFFNPSTTIVIPHDLHAGLARGQEITVSAEKPSINGKEKFFIKAEWSVGLESRGVKVNLLEITCDDITHGRVYSAPKIFQGLVDLCDSVGIPVVKLIRERLLKFVETQEGDEQIKHTAFILSLPIRRDDSSSVEREQVIGFYCNKSVKEMVDDFEVRFGVSGRLNKVPGEELRPMTCALPQYEIELMEVLVTPSATKRREQSGYSSTLSKGVLVGVGALGGTLLDIWVRGGWGQWTIIDEDIFRPHNFIRHVAPWSGLGLNKSSYCASVQNFHFDDASVVALEGDACQIAKTNKNGVYSSAKLVVDASASLDYPREVSWVSSAPRHMSAFFAPSGSDAVLLVEDSKRRNRLSYLEAQYYRALIELDVGDKHLTQDLVRFRSGVSCRDKSTVMSHARVLSLSSLLADQIRLASSSDKAQILIWQDDLRTGERRLNRVDVHKSKVQDNVSATGYKIIWDEGIEQKLHTLRSSALPNETGGILVGYHDMKRKHVYVVDALPAPPDSKGTPGTFDRGTEGIEEELCRIVSRTGANVGYIGEWHSHPTGSAGMSLLDKKQLEGLAKSMAMDGLPAFQMIVAQSEVKVSGKEGARG